MGPFTGRDGSGMWERQTVGTHQSNHPFFKKKLPRVGVGGRPSTHVEVRGQLYAPPIWNVGSRDGTRVIGLVCRGPAARGPATATAESQHTLCGHSAGAQLVCPHRKKEQK